MDYRQASQNRLVGWGWLIAWALSPVGCLSMPVSQGHPESSKAVVAGPTDSSPSSWKTQGVPPSTRYVQVSRKTGENERWAEIIRVGHAQTPVAGEEPEKPKEREPVDPALSPSPTGELAVLSASTDAAFPYEVPRESSKATLREYVIEPPDILTIECTRSLPGYQPITGEYLVRPDGKVALGLYGTVYLAGLNLDDAKAELESFLSKIVKNPSVSVDVHSYNSKVYYVIADGAGFGQQVTRLSFTGNETVLDAISQIGGLPTVASKRIWLARPDPNVPCCMRQLPVNWRGITECGDTETNWQIYPGDRIFVQSDCLLRFDSMLSKIIAPMERVFGITLLSGSTIKSYQNLGRNKGGATITVTP